jgi:autotransporter-associated beta strand protein
MTSPASLGNGALNIGANTFIYSPTTAGALNIGSGVLTLSGTIGTALGGTASQSAITSTGTAVLSGTTGKVNIYGITGFAPTAGSNNLITSTGGGLDGGTFTLGTVYNNTDFTVSAISRSATAISTTVTAATPLSGGVYWKGGLSGNTGVWSASTGLSGGQSNWQTDASGGSNQPLTPGATADLIFSTSTSPGTMVGMTLGANMTVKTLTVNDTATAFGLLNDGYKLTITPGAATDGITLNAGLAASPTIGANIELGAAQTWTNNSGRTLTVSGIVSGANNLTTAGANTITLTGANTYTGATTISAGTLLVNGSTASGSAVSVASGATLGGTGTISGATTVDGTLAAGNSIGKLRFGNNLTINDASVFAWELNGTSETGRGTNYDAVNVGGSLAAGGSGDGVFRAVLTGGASFADAFWTSDRTWTDIFMNSAETSNLSFSSLFSSFQYFEGSTNVTAGIGSYGNFTISGSNLTWTAIPEPTSALAGLLLTAGLLRHRRK